MKKSGPTYNDFMESRPNDLKKFYNLTDRQLEQAFRKKCLNGADLKQRREYYQTVYKRNRSDI